MANKNIDYNNESITMLKGPDKVRKRPGVIFGSDGLDGCEHSVFEIISNSIDEARSGFGNKIIFEAENLQYASMNTKLQLVQMVDRGALTPNEWREVFNLAPIKGGDEAIRRLDTAVVTKGGD